MENKIEVVPAKGSCSCNACMARNYDSSLKPQIGKRVDDLFEVHVNMVVLTLCAECLAELGMACLGLELEEEEDERPPP